MNENVIAILLLEKTKTLAVVEPFYRAVYHVLAFSNSACCSGQIP
jgi:hypothetical protein